jgi:hypothetical protein
MTNAVKGTYHKTVGLIFALLTITITITIIAILLPSS